MSEAPDPREDDGDDALAAWLAPAAAALDGAAEQRAGAVDEAFAAVGSDDPAARAQLPGADVALAAWLDRVRRDLEDEIDVRVDRRFATAEPPARTRVWIGAALALAAALVIAIGGWSALGLIREAALVREQAVDGARARASVPATSREPTVHTVDAAADAPLVSPPNELREASLPSEVSPPSEASPPSVASEPLPSPTTAVPRRKGVRSIGEEVSSPLGDELAALDRQGQARWRDGDLAGAADAFSRIVARGGRRTEVQTAYGELFTLAHQRGRKTELETLWRAYVGTFPKGRHADDARAGLCRTTDDAPCWQAYLRDFPRGAYRSQAERAVERVP